jgi:hypothetical protein
MTWCSVDSATPRFVLASSAIRCRFVDRFVRLKVLSRVSRQRFSPHDTPLSSIGSRESGSPMSQVILRCYDFPSRIPVTYLLRFRGPRCPPRFVSRSLRSRKVEGCFPGRGHCSTGDPNCRFTLTWTRAGSPRFPGDPSCAFASVYDPGRTDDPSPI